MSESDNEGVGGLNTVRLRGRVTKDPEVRVLPSGSEICSFRMSVRRDATVMTRGSAQTSDWFDCTAWTAAVRRTVSGWAPGDEVEIVGSLRRRHLPGTGTSLLDVEVLEARRARGTAGRRRTQSTDADSN